MKERGIVVLVVISLVLSIVALVGTALMNQGITDGSISESKLADSAVTKSKIAEDSIESGHISDHAITQQDLSEALSAKIALIGAIDINSITSAMVVNGTITSADIANNTIKNEDIAPKAIGTNNLANDSVTAEKIASGAFMWEDIGRKPLDIVGSGIIKYDGSIYEEYKLDKAIWDSTNNCYMITLENVSYGYKQHLTIVSPIGSELCTAVTTSSSGKLRVTLFDTDGATIQNDFSFIVYAYP